VFNVRVYTCIRVRDNIPCRPLPKYTDRRIPTHHKPSAGMPGPERPTHGLAAGRGDGYPCHLDWERSSS